MMRVANLCLTKDIHWLVSPSDKLTAPLKAMPGWAVLHPLTAIRPYNEMAPIHQSPPVTGGRRFSAAFCTALSPNAALTSAPGTTKHWRQ